MLRRISEDTLKGLGFQKSFKGNYIKYYPSNGEEGATKCMYAEVTEYWFDDVGGYAYGLCDGLKLWADEFVFKLGEGDNPRKMCEAIEKGFAEWKKDLRELRKDKTI